MKKIILLLFLFLACLNNRCLPQTSNWLWAKSGNDSTFYAKGNSISTDAYGHIFITGYFDSTVTFGSTTLKSAGWNDIFIVKYDVNGNVIWAKRAGGTSSETGWSITIDAGGNLFVAGQCLSDTSFFDSIKLINDGKDVFIAKYDSNGNALWAKNRDGLVGFGLSTDLSGNVFLTGCWPIFLSKYDIIGNLLWTKSLGGTYWNSWDGGRSVSTDANGNMFVTGFFESPNIAFGSNTLTNTDVSGISSDVFLVKYDASGNVLWVKSAGGIDYDEGFSVSSDINGNVFLTGYFASSTMTFGSTTLTSAGSADMFIAKYNTNGDLLWAKSVGGTNYDIGYSVSTDAGGNAFVTGEFKSSTITFGSITLIPPMGSTDPMFIVKYDANGNVLCASVLASGGYFHNYVSADPFGNAYIAGSFTANPFIVGTDTLTLIGQRNFFVAKWTCGCNMTLPMITPSTSTTFCQGDSVILTSTFANNYLWSTGDTTQSIIVRTSGNYTVTVSDSSGCKASSPATTVTVLNNANFFQTLSLCTGDSIAVGSNIYTASGTYQDTLTAANGCDSVVNTNLTLTPLAPLMTEKISGSNSVCTEELEFSISPIENAADYVWTVNNATLISGQGTEKIKVAFRNTDAAIIVLASNLCGKSASSEIFNVEVDVCDSFYIPNVFTPNGDGANDLWISKSIGYSKISCSVYNRWGNKMCEWNGLSNGWDGKTKNGIQATDGVYYYILTATKSNGDSKIFTGYVHLMGSR